MNNYRQSTQRDIKDREIKNRVRTRAIANNNSNVRVYNRPEVREYKLRESVNILKGGNKNIIIREYNNPNKFNNDKTIRSNPRSYGRPEGNSNGRGVWSRENTSTPAIRPQISSPSQSRQVRGESRPSSIQQARSSNSSSGPRSSVSRR